MLQQPPNAEQRAAQEYLALARERNGQIAHAKAEYERYLDLYPEGPETERVRQRLAALLAVSGAGSGYANTSTGTPGSGSNPWKVRTFLSQYYRRDVNQLNDLEEVTSQSSLYTDLSVDARRRGERFDISTRFTGGYRYDLLDEESRSSGNDFRLSYLYADLLDTRTRVRGRLGRQTRSNGGVLGRFDGLNVSYPLNERVRFDAVAGQPVYSTASSDEQSRMFYGVSSNFTPFSNDLEFGVFYLEQDIDSLTDRQAVGTGTRFTVPQNPGSFGHQMLDGRMDVLNFVADVMHAAAGIAVQEFLHRGTLAQWMQQLDLGVGQLDEHSGHAVVRQGRRLCHRSPERVAVQGRCGREIGHHDGNMIQLTDQDSPPNLYNSIGYRFFPGINFKTSLAASGILLPGPKMACTPAS